MTGPLSALALAHRRYVCGRMNPGMDDRLDTEDVEAALVIRRQLAEQGYTITRTTEETS